MFTVNEPPCCGYCMVEGLDYDTSPVPKYVASCAMWTDPEENTVAASYSYVFSFVPVPKPSPLLHTRLFVSRN
jgi:hypothetical protein